LYTDADNFGVVFPSYASPQDKALIFAATFLIDYLFFEEKPRNDTK
jgi:Scramblase